MISSACCYFVAQLLILSAQLRQLLLNRMRNCGFAAPLIIGQRLQLPLLSLVAPGTQLR